MGLPISLVDHRLKTLGSQQRSIGWPAVATVPESPASAAANIRAGVSAGEADGSAPIEPARRI